MRKRANSKCVGGTGYYAGQKSKQHKYRTGKRRSTRLEAAAAKAGQAPSQIDSDRPIGVQDIAAMRFCRRAPAPSTRSIFSAMEVIGMDQTGPSTTAG